MKKKYAFVLLGSEYNPQSHHATFETEKQITYIRTVRDFDEAAATVLSLQEEGVGAVELCGAFGEQKARELIGATDGKVAIGFVTHLQEQDSLFDAFFSSF
ncbi:MAG: DUF6506 family protein [Christensenella sp.]|uniref:DUF6506 family protein n=1 Tax=Christensenella sp. TaxID=1935934 RepID=UPI002B20CD90|nr:DUF6506 family protein [Christensenella sp.]MEA5004106.1 DUF6506 family protein [Christensenella sp.]